MNSPPDPLRIKLFLIFRYPSYLFHQAGFLDRRPARIQRLAAPILEEHYSPYNSSGKPEEHIGKIDPDRVLHSLSIFITLGIIVDI